MATRYGGDLKIIYFEHPCVQIDDTRQVANELMCTFHVHRREVVLANWASGATWHWDETPAAVVALVPGATLDLQSFAAHCRARVAAFKERKELRLVAGTAAQCRRQGLKRERHSFFAIGSAWDATNAGH